jgi:hypothetical protein
MRSRSLFILVLALWPLADAADVLAHPAPFEHRHVGRRASPDRPLPRARRPLALTRGRSHASLALGVSGSLLASPGAGSLSSELDSGLAMDLSLGVRLGRYASVHMGWLTAAHPSASSVDTFERAILTTVSFDVRAYLMPKLRWIEPFLQVGTGLVELRRDGGSPNTLTGPGFQAGLGASVPLNPSIALSASVLYRPALLEATHQGSQESELLHLFTAGVGMSLRL